MRSLTFGRTVTRDELVQTLRLLNYTPQRIRELGGMELLLEKEGVSGVQANKVRYGIIGDSGQGGTSTVPMTVDESLIAQLMNTVQVGQADFGEAAQSVERSLEDTGSPDSSAVLFRIFQNMAQGSVEPEKPLRERFLEMFRSFTPKMQGKLLLTAVLNRALLEKSSLNGFYYELKPEELESPITAVLMLEQATDQELQGFADALMQDAKLLLPDSIRQKMTQRGLLKPQETQPSPSEDLRKKAVLDAGDYPRLLYFVRQEIDAGKLDEADKLSKKLLSGMTSHQADQRSAAVRMLPLMVQELSSHEKWKNVETSISFLVANHFRKESEATVIEAYAEYLGAGFRKKLEANDIAGCKEYLSLLAAKPEAKAAIAEGLCSTAAGDAR